MLDQINNLASEAWHMAVSVQITPVELKQPILQKIEQIQRLCLGKHESVINSALADAIVAQMLGEDFSETPNYTTNMGVKAGDSKVVATTTKKEGDEYKQTGEEKREVAIADKILKAANNMVKTPDVEEVVRLATELKKMHGV